jgi:diacylglycerol kinase family enzyme
MGKYPIGSGEAAMNRRRRVAAIVNRAAGAGENHSVEGTRSAIETAFADQGIDAEIAILESSEIVEHAIRARNRASRGEIDAVVVGGGDGTIRSVAHVLAGTGLPLAILPLGTMNHFAKDLDIPVDLSAAMRVLAGFCERSVDLGEVNGEVFVNNSSIGIYPNMVVDRERRRADEGWAKWTAMLFAILRTFRRFPRMRLVLDADEVEMARRTPCVFVANNEYDMNFLSLGRKQLDEGSLYLYVAKPQTPFAFLWFVIRAGLGFAIRRRDLDLIRVREATIRSGANRLLVALDGEVRAMSTPLRYRVRPAALRVIVPAPG